MLRQGYLTRAGFVVNNATQSCPARRSEPQMTYASFALANAAVPGIGRGPRFSSPTISACAVTQLGKRVPRYCLFFCSDFSGLDLHRDEDQACFGVRSG